MNPMISTRETLQAFAKPYFTRPGPRCPGDSVVLIGTPKPKLAQELSYFVAKRSHRVAVKALRTSAKGHPWNVTHYRAGSVQYIVASICWNSWHIAELQSFPTKAEALAALRTI